MARIAYLGPEGTFTEAALLQMADRGMIPLPGALPGAIELVPALGWFAVSVVLSLPTSGGSVIIANSTAGQVYLYGGSRCAAAGVVVAFLCRARAGAVR